MGRVGGRRAIINFLQIQRLKMFWILPLRACLKLRTRIRGAFRKAMCGCGKRKHGEATVFKLIQRISSIMSQGLRLWYSFSSWTGKPRCLSQCRLSLGAGTCLSHLWSFWIQDCRWSATWMSNGHCLFLCLCYLFTWVLIVLHLVVY